MSDEVDPASLKLQLIEYEVRDRIQDHIWKSVTRFIWGFGVIVTLLGVVGIPTAINQIGDSVAFTIRKEIEEDSKTLRDRLTTDLAELRVTSKELKTQSAAMATEVEALGSAADGLRTQIQIAQKQLETMKQTTDLLTDLQEKYRKLAKETEELGKQTETAVAEAAAASENTNSLREGVAAASAGEPAFFSSIASPEILSGVLFYLDTSLNGTNLENERGSVKILSINQNIPDGTHPIELSQAEITSWSNAGVSIEYSEATLHELERWVAALKLDDANFPDSPLNLDIEFTTNSGKTVAW